MTPDEFFKVPTLQWNEEYSPLLPMTGSWNHVSALGVAGAALWCIVGLVCAVHERVCDASASAHNHHNKWSENGFHVYKDREAWCATVLIPAKSNNWALQTGWFYRTNHAEETGLAFLKSAVDKKKHRVIESRVVTETLRSFCVCFGINFSGRRAVNCAWRL